MLESITSPEDLRDSSHEELEALAAEIREFLVQAVAVSGGHLGPNLGVVELTIALHRAFDSPTDRIVWDTGHQAYVHKLLTGRIAGFATLRTKGGMSGYPSRSESPHDVIENSHASTALGYALGLAEAGRTTQRAGRVVAVVGDGSLTGGVALEALNLIGHRKPDLIAILNDNGRSYQPTVGGLAGHLAPLRLHPGYEHLKKGIDEGLRRLPVLGEGMLGAVKRLKEGAKVVVAERTLFEDLGWQYTGPIDGHDIAALEKALDHAKRVEGPVMVHVVTRKGSGYGPAEDDEVDHLHGVPAFDPETGRPFPKGGDATTFTDVFGDALLHEARRRPEVVAITAAMLSPTKLSVMADEMPDRVFDAGIAEQVAVTMAAGMALGGLRPVVAIYSTFLQRAFDQVLMDVCLHKLPVVFCLDRSGITGEDGSSHHGVFDVTWLREMPNLTIASPRDGVELRRVLATALDHTAGPFAIRFPKSATAKAPADAGRARMKIGTWQVLSRSTRSHGQLAGEIDSAGQTSRQDVLLLGLGKMALVCEEAAKLLRSEGAGVTVIDPRFAKPLDSRLAATAAAHRLVVTVEDNVLAGGFGSAVAEVLADEQVGTPQLRLGVPDAFQAHAKREQVLEDLGLDAVGIAEHVGKALMPLER